MDDLPERALAALEKYGGWYGVLRALDDAERYRFLREALLDDGDNRLAALDDLPQPESAADFDAAIDAAMREQGAN